MNVTPLAIPDVLHITPRVFDDERGFFYETFNQKAFADAGITTAFVQDNMSYSKKGVIRGMHYQLPSHGQAKFVYVSKGRILDVAVDVRVSSPTFGQYVTAELSDQNHAALLIPEGFAHGFVVLSDEAYFHYKVSNYYAPDHERGFVYNDPEVAIPWETEAPLVSQKDSVLPLLQELAESELYE